MDFEAHDASVIADMKEDMKFAAERLRVALREIKKGKPNPDRVAQLIEEALARID